MNNDKFKTFIAPYVEEMFSKMGGVDAVREMHKQIPEGIIHFVTGGVYGLVAKGSFAVIPHWRDAQPYKIGQDYREHVTLSQEEVRRTLDYVRLRLESGSATS